MGFWRAATVSMASAFLALPAAPTTSIVGPAESPTTTTNAHRFTRGACPPDTAGAVLVGTVPHVGRLTWVTPTTLQIRDSATTIWTTEVHGRSLRPAARQDHDSQGDPFDVTIPAIDAPVAPVLIRNRATGRTSSISNVHVQDVAPDRPVMLIDVGIMNFVEVDLATLRHGRTFIGFTTASPLWSATYSPSGQMIVVTDRTSLTLFDTRTGQLRGTIARQDWVDAWRLSPDEHYLAVDDSRTLSVINALTLRLVWSTKSDQYAISTAVDDNASASVAGNCRWTIFDRHGFMTRSIPIDGVIASDGRHIARSTQNGTFVYRLS